MHRFEATNRSRAAVPVARDEVWAVLTDPDLLAELTPLVARIDDQGSHWCWHLAGIEALGLRIAPSFRERMEFVDGRRLVYRHEPEPGRTERAGADGTYHLDDHGDGGTCLEVDITLHVDLPLPRAAGPAVRRVMERSMHTTGQRFGVNLLTHLGVR